MAATTTSSEKTNRAKTVAYEVLAEHNPDPWSPVTITDQLVNEAYDRVKSIYSAGGGWLKKAIRTWLEDPAAHDPHLDTVAVDRASALDYNVFTNLTLRERDAVVDRLSRMADPWGLGADVFSEDPTLRFSNSGVAMGGLTPRAERWKAWPKADRDKLKNTVGVRRNRREGTPAVTGVGFGRAFRTGSVPSCCVPFRAKVGSAEADVHGTARVAAQQAPSSKREVMLARAQSELVKARREMARHDLSAHGRVAA